jgi:tryptophanyl-tRNA synthetase
MKKLVCGITPTGTLTLGHYLGVIRHFEKLQTQYEVFAFVANLHAITLPYDMKDLSENTLKIFAMYLACGVDIKRVKMFIQSDIPNHSHLGHILLCHTTLGELERMTQFKDKKVGIKSSNGTEFIPTGLLTYPTLMASDILLYDADLVLVGQDQIQHIELARDIAQRINNKLNYKVFTIPSPFIIKDGSKIMSLQEPDKKMSKSDKNVNNVIFLLDDLKDIEKKIMSAKTDSENKVYFDVVNKPGVSNLMNIYSCLKQVSIEETSAIFKDMTYKDFKVAVFNVIKEKIVPIQEKYKEIIENGVAQITRTHLKELQELSVEKMNIVQEKMGLKLC